MRDLKEVLEQNKEKYIEELKNLVGIDTHDLGHGIDGSEAMKWIEQSRYEA